VCLGQIVAPHGVRGLVKVRSFTAHPRDLGRYGPLEDDDGRRFEVRVTAEKGSTVVAALSGIENREAAEALRGRHLYVARSRLPEPDVGEFYEADLVGLVAVTTRGETVGRVTAVFDFGGGPVLEIAAATGRTVMVPFSGSAVPEVDLAARRLVLEPGPAGLLADEEDTLASNPEETS
jgi:16S rRNA processing protein RimM